jgi:LysR family glycine cleavage system transcriptional activator
MYLTRRQLPLNAMRAFEAVAKHCHMRRAADELGVTHAAISRHVRLLEDLLAVSLFDRAHNRLQLTAAGKRLHTTVESAFEQLSQGALYLDPDAMQGSLVVATTPSISVNWLVRLMGEFSQKYPEIELRLVNIQPGQRTLPAEAEIAVCYDIPDEPKREVIELYRENRIPVCSPTLLRDDQAVTSPQEVLAYPLIHDRHNSWPHWFSKHGINATAGQKNLTLHDTFQAIAAMLDGFGIALVDRNEVPRELHNGSLVALMESGVTAQKAIYLAVEPVARQTVRAKLFQAHLLNYMSERGVALSSNE